MNEWNSLSINLQASMKDALAIIDKNAKQIALVIDANERLLGTVTDGDIRRALLRGDDLTTPVEKIMNTNPTTGLYDEDHETWQRTMRRHTLQHLPLLNANGRVVGLTRYILPSEPRRQNLIVLMAGGLGSRLRPLTYKQPKPLLKVGSKPILETIIDNFAKQGFYRFYLCINYKGYMIRDYFQDGRHWDVEINYIEEPKKLGTAGALSLLPEIPDSPFFVMNGDLLTKVDFVRLLQFHLKQESAATMCVREYSHTIPYGVTQLDGYQVTELQEKPTHRYYTNAGIYTLNPDIIKHIPENTFYDMPTLLNQLLSDKQLISSFPLREYWIDIGRASDFEQARLDYDEFFNS